jgi:hypothetical protein
LIPNHKGDTIGRMIKDCLLKRGISKIFTITVDNASSNYTALEYLKDKYKRKESSVLECEFLQMRCCAHILNLIVQDGLKDLGLSK